MILLIIWIIRYTIQYTIAKIYNNLKICVTISIIKQIHYVTCWHGDNRQRENE